MLDESTTAGAKSLLGDLPPLGGPSTQVGKNPSAGLSLAPLKKVPPVAKVEATKQGINYLRTSSKKSRENQTLFSFYYNDHSNFTDFLPHTSNKGLQSLA